MKTLCDHGGPCVRGLACLLHSTHMYTAGQTVQGSSHFILAHWDIVTYHGLSIVSLVFSHKNMHDLADSASFYRYLLHQVHSFYLLSIHISFGLKVSFDI